MKTFKKRLSAVLLSVYMVFGVVSTDYLTAQAFEWVVPSLTVGESLLWLMGLFGMIYTEGASAWRDVSPEYEQDFIDYANEHGLTYTETSSWLNDTASGKLNQLSQVWSTFKEWVVSLIGSSSGDLGDFTVGSYIGVIQDFFGTSYSLNGISNDVLTSSFQSVIFYKTASNTIQIYFFTNVRHFEKQGSNNYIYPIGKGYNVYLSSSSATAITNDSLYLNYTSNPSYTHYFVGVLGDSPFSNIVEFISSGETDSDFATYNPALIPDISFADSNTEDASIPGVIDLPWGNLGDDEEERDKTYDDLVSGLDLGQEIGDLWQALQDLMGVLAVDDAGVLQPNSGGENPPTLEDEVENNKLNGAFVLTGLQKVFPFCIPFDLYAFITLLEAPPVAPVIQYPIYNPVTDSNEIITIDFSTWESVVILFRYIFDFLFIIGLLLIARALIGGGDSA